MKQGEKNPIGFYTIGIVALFLAGFFLLVVFGARSYRGTVASQNGNMDHRALLAYPATAVKANDIRGAVEVRESEKGQVLVIADGDSGYALRVYRHEGKLVEDYSAIDAPLQPSEAQTIAETKEFSVERPRGDLLVVHTDAGRAVICLRSEGSDG